MPPAAAETETQEFFGPGIAVEIGQIQRELKKLWRQSEDVATRASRLNLVIYSAADHSMLANTELVEKIARQHALRAILIAAKAHRPGNRIRSWVNAHCQISKTGTKQRCSEQIAFEFEGAAADFSVIPNLVFAHLDSDLPLYLWWQGEFPAPAPDERLMAWVDRLIFDSADWPKPAEQIAVLRTICASNPDLETALGDLNWTRLNSLRLAIAQFFDSASAREALTSMEAVEITHAPHARLFSLMLVSWLAAKLNWRLATNGSPVAGKMEFRSGEANHGPIQVLLKEQPTANNGGDGSGNISQVTLRAANGAEFTVSRDAGSSFYNTSARSSGGDRALTQVLPAGQEELHQLVCEELVHSGNHRTYLKAITVLESILRQS